MANLVYILAETATVWRDTGGDLAITLAALAADGVRVGAQGDLGSAARSEWYEWRIQIDGFDTAPVVGETVDAYISTSNAAGAGTEDGDVGIADAAGATTDLPNLLYLGSAVVQTTTATDELMVSGIVRIVSRYVMPVIHNNTVDVMETTTPSHTFTLTPVPPQIQ